MDRLLQQILEMLVRLSHREAGTFQGRGEEARVAQVESTSGRATPIHRAASTTPSIRDQIRARTATSGKSCPSAGSSAGNTTCAVLHSTSTSTALSPPALFTPSAIAVARLI
jgi:hypothetical protein